MSGGAWQQYRTLVAHGIRCEIRDKERVISPLLFATTILLLLSIVFGDVDATLRLKTFLVSLHVTVFFAIQVVMARVLEPLQEDGVFTTLKTYPVSSAVVFLAQYSLVLCFGVFIVLACVVCAAVFAQAPSGALSLPVVGALLMSLAGNGAVGILLSGLTHRAQGRQVLFPLLYFPLTTPVLLAATQYSELHMNSKIMGTFANAPEAWLGLLSGFSILYISLGILLFGELADG